MFLLHIIQTYLKKFYNSNFRSNLISKTGANDCLILPFYTLALQHIMTNHFMIVFVQYHVTPFQNIYRKGTKDNARHQRSTAVRVAELE